MRRDDGRSGRRAAALACAIVLTLAGGCQDGGSDVDVDQAAAELERAAVAVLTAVVPGGEVTAGVRVRPCLDTLQRESGEFIAALDPNTVASGGDIADTPVEELEARAREALETNGFAIEEDFPGPSITGERGDGLRLGVTVIARDGAVVASGSTGCRPPAG